MPLRWGIVSAGKISHDFVCALKTHPPENHQALAIGARALNSAKKFAKKHKIPKAYQGYDALAKDKDIDIIYIGVLNPQHLPVAMLMLDHGKHVLCEKPLAMNKREAQELIEHAQAKKLFLMEAVWSRCFPVYDEFRKQIEEGAIGDVLQVNVDFGFPLEHVDRVNVKEMGGSTILDIGIYALQLSQYVYRGLKPESVVASGSLNQHGTDDTATAIIQYPGGRTSVLTINSRVQLSNTAYIFGTKGMLKIPNFWCPSTLITPTKTLTFGLPASTAIFNYLNSSGLAYEAEEARKCIQKVVENSYLLKGQQNDPLLTRSHSEIRGTPCRVFYRAPSKMPLRWGIVSAGKISHDFVCALKTHPPENHQALAIGARALNSAKKFAKKHKIPKAYQGYEALAKDKDIDIIYIGVLNPQHLPVAMLMLDHGKHVLCEKPLAMNKREAQELIEHAQAKKLFLMEAVWSRCFPVYDEFRKQIEEGAIGDVLQVNVDFGFPLEHVDRVNVKEMGGSTILDIGIYALQLSQYVYRGLKPESVVASGSLNQHGTDDTATAIIQYPGGRTSVLTINSRVQLSNTAYIFGTKGMLKIPNFWCPSTLITPTKTLTFGLPASTAIFNYLNSSGLAYEAEEARKCIQKGLTESPKMTQEESLQLAELMDTLRKAVGNVFPQDICV